MANDLNQCQFIGRLGKDVDTRYMPNGDHVASFSLAVGSSWNDKSTGEKKETTEWVNCTAFRKLGEICTAHLRKGSQVFVSGRMKTEKYTDKQGVERYTTKIVIENMQMLGGKRNEEEQPKQSKPGSFDDMEDDAIPF